MSGARLVVFGRTGQLARELARAALPAGWTMAAVGREEADLAGPGEAFDRAIQRHGSDSGTIVLNAAAYTAVDKAEGDAATAFAVNRDGPAHLARACALHGVPLIHISTDYVFDGTKSGAYNEGDPVNPLGVYGASKEAGERAVREAQPRHVILRASWVYSPFGHNFVKTMLKLGGERPELRIVDDQRGCPTAARDLAAAIVAIARQLAAGKRDGYGTFHYAGAGDCTWFGFAREIFAVAGRHGRPVPRLIPITTADYPTPARRPANSVLDCAHIRGIYGIRPADWRASLADCLGELLDKEPVQ